MFEYVDIDSFNNAIQVNTYFRPSCNFITEQKCHEIDNFVCNLNFKQPSEGLVYLILALHSTATSVVKFEIRTFHFGHEIVEKFNIVNSAPQICVICAVRIDGFQIVIDQFEDKDSIVDDIAESQWYFGESACLNLIFNLRDVFVNV